MAKRVMADIVSSPLVLMPFMVGSMAFTSLFALGLKGSAAVGAVRMRRLRARARANDCGSMIICGMHARCAWLEDGLCDARRPDACLAIPLRVSVTQVGTLPISGHFFEWLWP